MNILIFSWRGPKHPNAGGAEISTQEHAEGWVKAGNKVTLFTSFYKGAKKTEYIDGVRIIRKGSQVIGVHLAALKWYLFDRKENFDVVIDQFHGIPFFIPLYVTSSKIAFIHEVTKEVWKFNPWLWPLNKIISSIGEFIEPWVFRILYNNIPFITVSESTKLDLVDWNIPSKSIKVIYNGTRVARFVKLPLKEKKNTVIYLGSVSKDKGIEDALLVFSHLSKEENWQFWIVGKSDPKYLQFIKKQAQALNIFDKVKFWGYVSEKVKYQLLAKAHIAINPSIREGWGLVVIEAASVGTPTVGYNVPGLNNSILDNKTGILCNPKPTDCAEAISSFIKDGKKYQEFRKNCINRAKKFKWEDACKQSLDYIQSVVYKY